MNFDGTPLVIRHRVNKIEGPAGLRNVDPRYGVEIDIRHDPYTGRLYLSHDPLVYSGEKLPADDFDEYMEVLASQGNRFVIFNVKEMGLDKHIIATAKRLAVEDYFFLDNEFPAIYRGAFGKPDDLKDALAQRQAIRYSEAEPIEQALKLQGKYGWVWVDVNTMLPLNAGVYRQLIGAGFKIALVCPECRGRPQDIPLYIAQMKREGVMIDTVMTGQAYVGQWENSEVLKPFSSRKN